MRRRAPEPWRSCGCGWQGIPHSTCEFTPVGRPENDAARAALADFAQWLGEDDPKCAVDSYLRECAGDL